MKKSNLFYLLISLALFFSAFTSEASIHFTESFTSTPFSPSTYTSGTGTLSSGTWDYQQVRQELASNAYGGTGGAVRLAKNISNAYLIAPSVNSIGTISFYYRTLNTGSGTFKVQKSVSGGAFTDIASQTFNSQTYSLFTITINDPNTDIRIKILSDNNPENLIIDEVQITNYDITPPIVFANAQTVTNTGPSVQVQSNEADGFVYIIKDGIAQTTLAHLNTAVTNLQGAKATVTAANTDMNVSALNLQIGNYYAYAVDGSDNISIKGTNIIQVVNSTASISGVAFANGNYIIGDVVPLTITANGSGYTAGTITVNGRTATGFTDNGNNTYSVIYTIQEGDADASQTSDVPLSVILINGASPSAAFTGPATGTVTIDANRPLISTSARLSDTQIKLTTNEFLDPSTITQMNDGGFIISDLNNSSIHYTVTAVNPGANNSEVILSVVNFGVSELSGLSLQYTVGGNGIITDAAGNFMMTTYSIPAIEPWNGTGITEVAAEKHYIINVYPNPASNVVNITAAGFSSGLNMALYSVQGQLIFSNEISADLANQIDVSGLTKGIYILKVSDIENAVWDRLIIQ